MNKLNNLLKCPQLLTGDPGVGPLVGLSTLEVMFVTTTLYCQLLGQGRQHQPGEDFTFCPGLYWGKGLQTLFLCLLSISLTEPGSFEAKERTLWAVSEPACGPGDWVANKTGKWFTVYEINEKQRASQGRALPKVTARQWQHQPRSLNPLTSCPRFLLAFPPFCDYKKHTGLSLPHSSGFKGNAPAVLPPPRPKF